jgi:DNA-binding NarL/FixJ family response regulator
MRFPIVATHPCNLIHNPLRQLFTKSRFRLTRIETTLSEELVTYLRSLESCLWLVGVERCLATTNALVRRVVTTTPGVKAVILAAHQTPNDIIPALEAGACGFLCQDTSAERLLKSLELIVVGEMVVHPQLDVVPQATNGKPHLPQPLNQRVPGSSPGGLTIKSRS